MLTSSSVNVILVDLNTAKTPMNFDLFPRLLTPHGIVIFLIHCKYFSLKRPIPLLTRFAAGSPSGEEGFVSLNMHEFISKLQADLGCDVTIKGLPTGQTIVLARNFTPPSVLPEELTTGVVFHHFLHGNEGELVEKVKQMSAEGELWIARNDDAAGISALGDAAGLNSEETQFTIHSVLFEDTSLTVDEHEGWIHTLRQIPRFWKIT